MVRFSFRNDLSVTRTAGGIHVATALNAARKANWIRAGASHVSFGGLSEGVQV